VTRIRLWLAALLAIVGLGMGSAAAARGLLPTSDERFPHQKHAKVFPMCTTCHAGMAEEGASVWPAASSCEACHDGTVEKRIEWTPRAGSRASNLRFRHLEHTREALGHAPEDSAKIRFCGTCHNQAGAPRMAVQRPLPDQCMTCHKPGETHLAISDTACATCHLTLASATSLPEARVAAFPKPPSHDRDGFVLGGHGKIASVKDPSGRITVAASCATCHARDFCLNCHVNGPEVEPIQALAPDPRSRAIAVKLPVPAGHKEAAFLGQHGRQASKGNASCSNCHVQSNCTTCHIETQPRAIATLAMPGPGRAAGPTLHRKKPESHDNKGWAETHGPEANAKPASCEACHARTDCLDCHRPSPDGGAGYHPAGFLTRHPVSAYNRDATCSDCHNPAQFCQSCHQQAGFRVTGRLGGASFHDGRQAFFVGHGQAARQNLESCASCHAERDCTACHSAVGGGYGFSPHGPGFDPERLRRKNPSLCVACHGTGIPGLP